MLGLAMGLGNSAKEALMELEKKYRQKMTNLRKAAKKRVEDDPAKEKDQDIKEPLMTGMKYIRKNISDYRRRNGEEKRVPA